MLGIFCLRLACGLAGSLLLLNPAQVNPRFYKVHFLTVLGLAAVALVLVHASAVAGGGWLWLPLVAGLVLALLGSVSWSLEGAPGGRTLIVLTLLDLVVALVLLDSELASRWWSSHWGFGLAWTLAGSFTSAALLGTATTAMLMGHSYLIAPAMSLVPLLRLLAALGVSVLLRLAVAAGALWSWTAGHSLFNLGDVTVLWLPLRWGLGFAGTLLFGWMAWQTARIRSTQSATGILYVVVIFCFLGELTGQLLQSSSGFPL
jgi:hypothetical protein